MPAKRGPGRRWDHRRLRHNAVNVIVGAAAHERAVYSAAFLVEERRIERFDAAADAIAREQADRMRFRYTGPVPPFSFVALEESAAWG